LAELKGAIALLPDRELANRLAAAALAAHRATAGRLRWPRLPPHLSLEQPFVVPDTRAIERYLEQLAASLPKVSVSLAGVEQRLASPHGPEAIVWVAVQPSEVLLTLHERLDADLGPASPEPSMPLEEERHRFHLTLGFLPAWIPGLDVQALSAELAGTEVTFAEAALFLYDGLPRAGWQSMLYRRVRLGSGA
jgi:2'-5' RNA ligase